MLETTVGASAEAARDGMLFLTFSHSAKTMQHCMFIIIMIFRFGQIISIISICAKWKSKDSEINQRTYLFIAYELY